MIRALLLLIAASARAVDFSIAVPCSEGEASSGNSYSWCIEGRYPGTQKVSFLERSGCHATTAGYRTIEGATETTDGTVLKDLHCSTVEYGDPVALDIDIKKYRKLAVRPLPGKAIPGKLDARIRKSAAFRKLVTEHDPPYVYGETLNLYLFEIQQSTRAPKTYVAIYQSEGYDDQFVFLVTKERIHAITEDEPACVGTPEAFHLNGIDFLRFDICACGTDGCDRRIVGIPKP